MLVNFQTQQLISSSCKIFLYGDRTNLLRSLVQNSTTFNKQTLTLPNTKFEQVCIIQSFDTKQRKCFISIRQHNVTS